MIPHPVTVDPVDAAMTHGCPISECPWEHREEARTVFPIDGDGRIRIDLKERERRIRDAVADHASWHTPLEWANEIALLRHFLERAEDALRRRGIPVDRD